MSWNIVTLEQLAAPGTRQITDGPFGSHLASRHYTSSGPRVIRLQNIGDGEFIDARAHISEEHYARLSTHSVEAGDLLVASLGDSLPRACLAPSTLGPAIVKADCIRVRLASDVNPKWVMYSLISPQTKRWADAQLHGTGRPRLGLKAIRQIPVPSPSLAQQKRLVEIIEDHLSRLDAADGGISTALARVRALEEQIIRSALVDATSTMHRPTPELPNVGTDDSTIVPLPPGWRWVRLDDVADVVGGVTKDSKKQADPSLVEVPYLRVANVQRGRLDLSEIATIRVTAQKAQALELRVGDVLLNEGGDRDKLARGWVWEGQIPGCIHQNHVFRARIKTDLDPYFLSLTANTFGSPWAMRNGKQSVNLASISQTVIRKMPVILPPSGESGRIAARVTEQLDTNGRLREELLAARRRSATLRRAVLAAAFSGRLTGVASDSDLIEQQASELDEAVHASTEVRADEQIPLEAPHPG